MGDTARVRYPMRFGAAALSLDGEVGTLRGAIVAPRNGQLTCLVIRKGLLVQREVLVPTSAVLDASLDQLKLALTSKEFDALPGWHAPWPLRAPSESNSKKVSEGYRMVALDAEIGAVELLLMQVATCRVQSFVVRTSGLLPVYRCVPAERVRRIAQRELQGDFERRDFDNFPEFLTDDEIVSQVFEALWMGSSLERADIAFLEMQVRDGEVYIKGNTRTEESKAKISEIVSEVRGVLDVQNDVESFEYLATAALRQVGLSPQTPRSELA